MTIPLADEVLQSIEFALPISLISTPRHMLTTCSQRDRIEDVINATGKKDYDYVPVRREEHHDEIIGVLSTKPHREGTVRDELDPVVEPLLMGGDASILDFVRDAETKRYRLVVSGTRICGLVTLSDLQKAAGSRRLLRIGDRPRARPARDDQARVRHA